MVPPPQVLNAEDISAIIPPIEEKKQNGGFFQRALGRITAAPTKNSSSLNTSKPAASDLSKTNLFGLSKANKSKYLSSSSSGESVASSSESDDSSSSSSNEDQKKKLKLG